MPAGRPTKYRSEYCEMLIEHMAQGLSKEAFAGVIGVAEKTIYNWADEFPEFLQAIKIGEAKSKLVWENLGMSGAKGEIDGFNAASWVFNMKNRFHWRDKQEISGEDGGALVVKVVKHSDAD